MDPTLHARIASYERVLRRLGTWPGSRTGRRIACRACGWEGDEGAGRVIQVGGKAAAIECPECLIGIVRP